MTPMRDKINRRWLVAPALVSILFLSSCLTNSANEDNDASNVFVTITAMHGASEGATAASGDDLFSDVCQGDASDPTITTCVVVNDNGVVEMLAHLKDQTLPLNNSPNINDVIFERYHVTYVRADGRNVPGVDVPYPWDGVTNFTVRADGTAVTRAFMVVRQQAKLEPPLVQLAGGGALVLSTLAQIDFYGHDVAGRTIKVTGYLNVTFADF